MNLRRQGNKSDIDHTEDKKKNEPFNDSSNCHGLGDS